MVDFSTLFTQLLSTYWWAIPLLIFAVLFKSAWFKGFAGEVTVNRAARLFLDKNVYHLIKNATIPTEDGTTQVDHIIVSRFGVFVVETKNMKGWIFGSEHQKTWTQQIIQQITDGRLKPSIKTHIQHARHVKKTVAAKQKATQSPAEKLCPKCGSAMVLRTAKKSPQVGNQFLGCSAYPKCRTVAAYE